MIIENSFALDISRGKVPKVQSIEKFGYVHDMGTGEMHDIIDGTTTYSGHPVSDVETMEVLSSDTADKDGGTGANTVTIYNILDANGAMMPDVTVTLDGTTAVSMGTTEYFRASRAKVRTAGNSGSNTGIITVRHSSTITNRFCIITAGENRTGAMVYTVPLGKTLHINGIHANLARSSGAAGSAEVALLERPSGEVFSAIKHPDVTTSLGYDYESDPVLVQALSDIKGHVHDVSDALTHIYMEISGVLVDN